jgi:hypothetical protein
VHGTPGALSLLVAQLVAASAESARAGSQSTLTVRVSADEGAGVVLVADNGNGNDARAAELGELGRELLAPWGGTIDAASAVGQGCAFELRLATSGA